MSDQDNKDPAELLLRDSDLEERSSQASPDEQEKFREQLFEKLEVIANSAPPDEAGGPKVVAFGWSIPLKGTLWPLCVVIVKLAASAHDPSGLSWKDTADSVLDFLTKLGERVRHLGPNERLTCTAIADICRQQRLEKLKPQGASRDDILRWFDNSDETMPTELSESTFDDFIGGLVRNGVLTVSDVAGRGKIYAISF